MAIERKESGLLGEYGTANDQFKRSFSSWFWGSVCAAVLVHLAIFVFWPQMQASGYAAESETLEQVNVVPEVEIPPPPEQIQRPARPVISDVPIDEDITIAPTTFQEVPDVNLPPPPKPVTNTGPRQANFVPRDVEPQIRNAQTVQRALQDKYPPVLRDSGVEGSVNLSFWVEEDGSVSRISIAQSSGYDSMDQAAIAVAPMMQFEPAKLRDKPVAVPVTMKFEFRVIR